ncbi:MAG: hypothetical protein ABI210_01100 [Abditibacteriaceae bacterium]
MFTDYLYDGKTEYARAYENTDVYELGQRLFEAWRHRIQDYQHGDEYRLVDDCAKILGLTEWYEWQQSGSQPAQSNKIEIPLQTPEGPTNPELLKQRESATVMYCVAALKRFAKMQESEVFAVTSEIAMVGQDGIDYADPDRRYHLQSLPGEDFTGLQLLSLLFVGFKQIAPEMDTMMDFQDAYDTALQLYQQK